MNTKKNKICVLFNVMLLFAVSISLVSAEVLFGNATINNSQYFNISNRVVSSVPGDIQWSNTSGITFPSYGNYNFTSGPEGFFNSTAGNAYLQGAGGSVNIADITKAPAPNATNPFENQPVWRFRLFPLFHANDGIYFLDSQNRTGIFVVTVVTLGHVNITYKLNNQSGNITLGTASTTGCAASTNQTACTNQLGCFWDFFNSECKTMTTSGGGGGGSAIGEKGADCYVFKDNQNACVNVTSCSWSSNTCINGANFNFTTGIECGNINESNLCNGQSFTKPLCSWNGTTCIKNSTKSWNDVPQPPVQFCEAAGTNQTMCNLLKNQFFMPCTYNNFSTSTTADDKCTFSFDAVFSNPGDDIFDACDSKLECDAIGGNWKSEVISFTDTYGNVQTQTDNWCELSFGDYAKESCNDACWACEYNTTGGNKTAWSSVLVAQQQCENSQSGVCKFYSDSNAFNGFGWCEPKQELKFGFKNSCSNDCHSCFDNSTCSASLTNCTWIPEQFSIDVNGDGSFNATSDGKCESKLIASEFDCNQNCQVCVGQSSCSSSQVAGGCYWNTTLAKDPFGNSVSLCIKNGTPTEICFMPGDEDNDGLADCADINASGGDCTKSPACGSNSGMGFQGGAAKIVDPSICIQNDNNQSACIAQNGTGPLANISVCFYHPAPGQLQNFPAVGWCDSVMEQEFSEGMSMDSPPAILGNDDLNDSFGQPWLDYQNVGVKDSGDKIFVGSEITNLTNWAGCNKVFPTGTNRTGIYFQFFDVDGNTSTGCMQNSTLVNNTNITQSGFEYYFVHFRNKTKEIISSYRCFNGSWVTHTATADHFKEVCNIGGPPGSPQINVHALGINKMDIGSPKKPIRIYLISTNETRQNASLPIDTAGPFYYTPGSVDIKFEDCSTPGSDKDGDGLNSENDPDCQKFLKFGYTPMEVGPMCSNGKDDDNDGLVDCSDDTCKYDPFSNCNVGSVSCDSTDKTAPQISFLKVNAFPEGAFADLKSNKATNATFEFYLNDTKCTSLNKTILPFELEDSFTGNEFIPFHGFPIEQFKLGFSLQANRTYFYKVVLQDICGNKAVSACNNFTTPTSVKEFVFKPFVPPGVVLDIPQFGLSNELFSYGKKINQTLSKDFELKYKNTSQGWNIGVNCSLLAQASINASPIYNKTGNDTYVGFQSSQWQKLQETCGSKPTTIEIPLSGNGSQIADIFKCDDTNVSNCVNVTSKVNCTLSSTTATCNLPAGLGFSVYRVDSNVPTTTTTTTTTTTGGGGGGSYAAPNATTTANATKTTPAKAVVATAKHNQIWGELKPGKAVVTITKGEIGVTSIELNVKTTANNVQLSIENLADRPTGTSETKGKVYKYLSVTKTNLPDASIDASKIKFKAEKSWLTSNNINVADIVLMRYTTKWDELPTAQTTSDADNYYFEADTPGFSFFAIGQKESAATAAPAPAPAPTTVPVPTAPAPTTAPTPTPTPEAAPAPTVPAPSAPKGMSTAAKTGLILIAIAVIVAIVAIVMRKKK